MTREEAIAYGNDYYRDLITACCEIDKKHKEFVKMAIKALEQEPKCRDCVSRDYLLSIANKDGAYGYVSAHEIINAPSVNPQKIGHWIADVFVDKCSVCGEQTLFFEDQQKNFCPNCGARMVEQKESEDKE